MKYTKKIVLATAVFYFGISQAQQSQFFSDREQYKFGLAENLYQTKVYNASQYEYADQYFYNNHLSTSKKEASQFFDQVIGVILNKNHAEEGLTAFMKEYPHSAYFAQANIPLADYYLAQKDFEKALTTLKKVNQFQLSSEENREYILKLGYAKFMTGDSRGAIEALEESYKNANEADKGDIAYMLGHLYYASKKNELAFSYFDTIKNDSKFAKLVRPYYVQLFYNEKKYDQAISEGNALLSEDLSKEYIAEVHKIIGESYFMKDDFSSAYPHLKTYLESKNNPSDNDLYEMGFIAAQLRKFDEAISYYNQIINSSSARSQNAYYQLGNAYLEVGKKQEALVAFRSSKDMSYDENVRKMAHLQYAKLSYDIGNPYEAAPTVIQDFINKYPKSEEIATLRPLLVKSYLYSGNYKETLKTIDQMSTSNAEINKIDQEVSYLLGTEEFNKGNFDEAEKYFQRSLGINLNKEFHTRATYWLGQTYYQKGNYNAAITNFDKIIDDIFLEKQQLSYDLGYAYFKLKNFTKAKEYFKEYLKNPKLEFKNDASLRLADTLFANNELNDAIAIYDQAENADDYTLFQKAMAQGFKGDTEAKIITLKKLISDNKNSEYVDDAQYEIAVAYAANDDFNTSNDYFNLVIKNSTDKDLVANSSIYRSQNYIDQNQNEKALSELKSLGNTYRNTAYASKIVQASRPIFMKNGDVSGYQSFAQSLGISLESSEIDEINLNTAKNYYTKKEYQNAITFYEKYLTQNPTGEGLYQAQYELGESYYQTKNNTKALLVLQGVANTQNEYQEDAQTRIAQIHISQNNFSEAKRYLEPLSNSSNETVKNFSNVELMKIYAEEKNFSQAEKFANAVLANSKNATSVLEQAKIIKARSLMNNGKDKDAQSAFSALEKSSNPAVAAEALYAKAYYQNKGKAFKSSNETIFKLANNYASEDYWGAKALVIMAKNYIALKDNYQASYTCDQIISNYQDFPDVVAEAKEVKSQIKK